MKRAAFRLIRRAAPERCADAQQQRPTGYAAPAALRIPRAAALWAIGCIVAAGSATAFTESYRGLRLWAMHHGLSGVWADAWPLQLDSFIAVGELALFIGMVDQWDRRSRVGAWCVTLAGLVVSVAGNVGHVTGSSPASRGTAAVPPLAAAASLAVGLGVVKRIVACSAAPLQNAAPAGESAAPIAENETPALDDASIPPEIAAVALHTDAALDDSAAPAAENAAVDDGDAAVDDGDAAVEPENAAPESENAAPPADDAASALQNPEPPAEKAAPDDDGAATAVTALAKAAAIRLASAACPTKDAQQIVAWLAERGVTVQPSYVRSVLSRSRSRTKLYVVKSQP